MRAVLEARRKAALVRVEELEAELHRVRADLADAEEVLRRRVIGLEQYLEALAEEEAPAVAAGAVSRRRPVGPRRAVPHRENATGLEDLSVDYQAVMTAAAEAGGDGLGARRAAVVLGWDSASASRVEGARARLKRLVERGWLVETKPGRFTLPTGQKTDGAVRRGGGCAARASTSASGAPGAVPALQVFRTESLVGSQLLRLLAQLARRGPGGAHGPLDVGERDDVDVVGVPAGRTMRRATRRALIWRWVSPAQASAVAVSASITAIGRRSSTARRRSASASAVARSASASTACLRRRCSAASASRRSASASASAVAAFFLSSAARRRAAAASFDSGASSSATSARSACARVSSAHVRANSARACAVTACASAAAVPVSARLLNVAARAVAQDLKPRGRQRATPACSMRASARILSTEPRTSGQGLRWCSGGSYAST